MAKKREWESRRSIFFPFYTSYVFLRKEIVLVSEMEWILSSLIAQPFWGISATCQDTSRLFCIHPNCSVWWLPFRSVLDANCAISPSFSLFGIATAVFAPTFSFITSQCLSESARGVSWDLMWQNLFLVIVHSAIVYATRFFYDSNWKNP